MHVLPGHAMERHAQRLAVLELSAQPTAIIVDADADVRVVRRLRRDLIERGRAVDSILRQYEESVRPMHLQFVEPSKRFADVIIPGGGHNKVAIDLVQTKIRELLRERGVSVDAPIGA